MLEVELETTSMAVGGEAVGRDASGRVVFVGGALPGERVRVALTDEKRSFARGQVVEVLDRSDRRADPPCPRVEQGCGGCDWQHIEEQAQPGLRRAVVAEVLRRTGGVAHPTVDAGPHLPAAGLRTTVRGVADADGRFALRRRRSHDPIAPGSCLVTHPLVDEIVHDGRFPSGAQVVIRAGSRTGDRMVVVGPSAAGVRVPDGVLVVGDDELRSGRRAWIHEEVAGRRWRVSARSFFQASPEGAEALVEVVADAVDTLAPDAERLVDLCCGVGLFAGTVGASRSTVGVERSASAVADARTNLDGLDARLVKVALSRWRPSPADVVIADPARHGLGRDGVATVAGTGANVCVLVSCDPASLGRDAALLAAAGFAHEGSAVVDLFGHTSHIEVVSAFRRPPGGGVVGG